MLSLFKKQPYFFIPLFFWLLIMGGLLAFVPKAALFFWFNGNWGIGADYFFQWITFLGDGIFVLLLVVVLLLLKQYHRIAIIGVVILSEAIIVQGLKHKFFPAELRPIEYFKGTNLLPHTIEGVEQLSFNSFPSGHTATAFFIFCLLAYWSKKKSLGLLFFVLAALVGISRVYLAQHFVSDIYAGSVIGSFCSAIALWYFSKKNA